MAFELYKTIKKNYQNYQSEGDTEWLEENYKIIDSDKHRKTIIADFKKLDIDRVEQYLPMLFLLARSCKIYTLHVASFEAPNYWLAAKEAYELISIIIRDLPPAFLTDKISRYQAKADFQLLHIENKLNISELNQLIQANSSPDKLASLVSKIKRFLRLLESQYKDSSLRNRLSITPAYFERIILEISKAESYISQCKLAAPASKTRPVSQRRILKRSQAHQSPLFYNIIRPITRHIEPSLNYQFQPVTSVFPSTVPAKRKSPDWLLTKPLAKNSLPITNIQEIPLRPKRPTSPRCKVRFADTQEVQLIENRSKIPFFLLEDNFHGALFGRSEPDIALSNLLNKDQEAMSTPKKIIAFKTSLSNIIYNESGKTYLANILSLVADYFLTIVPQAVHYFKHRGSIAYELYTYALFIDPTNERAQYGQNRSKALVERFTATLARHAMIKDKIAKGLSLNRFEAFVEAINDAFYSLDAFLNTRITILDINIDNLVDYVGSQLQTKDIAGRQSQRISAQFKNTYNELVKQYIADDELSKTMSPVG